VAGMNECAIYVHREVCNKKTIAAEIKKTISETAVGEAFRLSGYVEKRGFTIHLTCNNFIALFVH
jgi:hypothetical protein